MRLEIKLDCQLQLPGGINGSGQRKCRGRQSSEQGYVPGHRVRGETAILVHIYKREVTSTGSQARIGAVPNVKPSRIKRSLVVSLVRIVRVIRASV